MRKISFIAIFFFFLSVFSNEKSIIESLSYLSLKTENLSIPIENVKRGNYSFYLNDYLLKYPQKSEECSENLKFLIENKMFFNLFKYINFGKFSKKNSKIEKNFSYMKPFVNYDYPSFLIDTLINDSIFFLEAEKFLSGCDEFFSSRSLENLLKEVERLFSFDKDQLLNYLKNNFETYSKSGIEVIIDSLGEDNQYSLDRPNVLIVDIGGNDSYFARKEGSLATGLKGFGGVVDFEGDDRYFGKNFDLGCGIFGIGFIYDVKGNDIYQSDFATVGSGFSGLGFIIDNDGNDSYISKGYSQGFGFTKGIGFIYDKNGNDFYLVQNGIIDHREVDYHSHLSQGFGFGIRDIASGGVGIILDLKGNDIYKGEYFVQGSSYWFSFGLLYDSTGNDTYSSRRYSQGAGTHFTTGVLIDREGDDSHYSWGVSMGCGHDFSSGFLFDYKGNDLYLSDWLSIGSGNANGNGILIDFEGDDFYSAQNKDCMGYGNFYRNTFSIGILFDKDGKDLYNGKNLKTNVRSDLGVLIDEK
ncbi:MAG: hypothetical protein XD76_0795 [candidate division TA06 bacterium 32_111]|uniref:Uncharacterized protein n=2 Tax=Bacteria candidate phyla TaxID=1783234 RepID=A0A101I3Z1_UNCT6|nr:MAG: hypothetical protein XD76_0795 [candidate division TA06 bacterium 32_111]KUK88253.1 MAG: hypothetical protein XE03_0259 [candidate division TA06 bacterium 34_109]HAF07186.1 hypothetical protein [candidate division WOR-3 bacterium]HCP16037.1 hypothetical protein [candidate division WOR-3 bacterium]